MQTPKQIINNPEIRSLYHERFNLLRSQFTISKFKSTLLVSLSIFTTLLVSQTLEIQHSCQPMFHSGTLPAKCLIATQADFNSCNANKSSSPKQTTQNAQKKEANNTSKAPEVKINQAPIPSETKNKANSTGQIVNEHSDDILGEASGLKSSIPSIIKNKANSTGQFVNEHSDDIAGGVAGIAAGAATLAAAGVTASMSVPVAGAVAIGLGIWFVIRSIF